MGKKSTLSLSCVKDNMCTSHEYNACKQSTVGAKRCRVKIMEITCIGKLSSTSLTTITISTCMFTIFLTGRSVNQSLYTFHKWLCDLPVTHWEFAPTCAFSMKQLVKLFKTWMFTEQHVCSLHMYKIWYGSHLDFFLNDLGTIPVSKYW